MPANVVRHVAEENIRKIGEQEIAEFFMRAYKELKVPLDRDKIAKAVQRIIDNVNLDDPDYLQALEPIAVEEVAKIADMNNQ
jgi:hypothetical protein